MKLTVHSFSATAVTATELDTANLPAEFVDRLIGAAYAASIMIDNGAIGPADDDDTEADEVATELTSAIDQAWRLHGKPTSVDIAVVRDYLNRRQEAEAAAAGAGSHDDLDEDADPALVP